MIVALNFVLFQLGWFVSVIGAANRFPWLGPVAVALIVAWHLRTSRQPSAEAMLIVASGVIGAIADSVLVALGWVQYPSGLFSASLAPYWIVTMWMLFATTINVSLRWLRGRNWLAVLLGLTGGPLSYVAGAELGGVVLVERTPALVALGVGWAVLLPLLVALGQRLDAGSGDRESVAGVVS